jgi:hypothetical protein
VGAHPNGETSTGKIGVIWIKPSAGFREDATSAQLGSFGHMDEMYDCIRVYSSTHPKRVGGFPYGEKKGGNHGVVWIKPESADMLWIKN